MTLVEMPVGMKCVEQSDMTMGELLELRHVARQASWNKQHRKALATYLVLERMEPLNGEWARRAGEEYRRLGLKADCVAALVRSADRFSAAGHWRKAIAVCERALQINPYHAAAIRQLKSLRSQAENHTGAQRIQGQRAERHVAAVDLQNHASGEAELVNGVKLRRRRLAHGTQPPPAASTPAWREGEHVGPPLLNLAALNKRKPRAETDIPIHIEVDDLDELELID